VPENPPHVIATRQKTDALFGTTTPLVGGGTFTSPVRRVAGYDVIAILAVSDQAFTIAVQEACESGGPFVQTQVLSSALVGGVQQIRTRIRPAGEFMILALSNGGTPMTMLEFCGTGIPQP
jgi:hypothetical protein